MTLMLATSLDWPTVRPTDIKFPSSVSSASGTAPWNRLPLKALMTNAIAKHTNPQKELEEVAETK